MAAIWPSRKDLKLNCFLQLAGVLDEFDHFLFALVVRDHLSDVLSEHIRALVAEEGPEVLDERLAEEDESFSAGVLKVNVEVVLLDDLTVLAQLLLDFRYQFAVARDFR